MSIEQQLVRRIDIAQVLSQLTAEQRSAIVLHYWGNLTCEDVASHLGWEEWKPKKRIYEALCAIRTTWGVVLPQKPDDAGNAVADDGWWPLVLESLRHAQPSHFAEGEVKLFLGSAADLCGNASGNSPESRLAAQGSASELCSSKICKRQRRNDDKQYVPEDWAQAG
jgi:hypothetical protein